MSTPARRRLHDLIDALHEADLAVVAQALAALTNARALPPVHPATGTAAGDHAGAPPIPTTDEPGTPAREGDAR